MKTVGLWLTLRVRREHDNFLGLVERSDGIIEGRDKSGPRVAGTSRANRGRKRARAERTIDAGSVKAFNPYWRAVRWPKLCAQAPPHTSTREVDRWISVTGV